MKVLISQVASWGLTEIAVWLHRGASLCINAVLRVQHWAADDTDQAGA